MQFLLDSDWAIDCLRGDRRATNAVDELRPSVLAISIISVAELYDGAYRRRDTEAHKAAVRELVHTFSVLSIDDSIADRFAAIRADLQKRGQPLPDFDLLIGATAIVYNLTLLTRNVRHFARIPGLPIYETST